MRVQKVLTYVAALLLLTLAIQIGLRYNSGPVPLLFAEWKDVPRTVEAANSLAEEVAQVQVTNIRRANDLVIKIEGEPNGEDRLPVEVVTLKVDKNHKGRSSAIELFHIGGFPSPLSRPAPPQSQAPPKPADGVERSQAPPRPTEEKSRPYMLHDDPEYKVGEKYLLFVRKGPQVTVGGATVQTHAIVSPTTRFRIGANNRLEAMTRRGFAPQFAGKNLRDLEVRLPRQ